jgi:LSU ribosomal protein L20P
MPRAKGGFVTRRRHKKILKMAKGFTGAKSKVFRRANEAVMKVPAVRIQGQAQ